MTKYEDTPEPPLSPRGVMWPVRCMSDDGLTASEDGLATVGIDFASAQGGTALQVPHSPTLGSTIRDLGVVLNEGESSGGSVQ